LLDVGLEQFELEPDAAGLAPQQELGVREGQPAGIRLERQSGVGMGLEGGPGVGQAVVVNIAGRTHARILTH
jgi:hypothetical protein